MVSIRRVLLNKVFPKLHGIEENPTVVVLRSSGQANINPFNSEETNTYDVEIEIPCLFSQQPEMVTSSNNIVVSQATYLYLKSTDIDSVIMTDRFIFRNERYKPVEIQDLFGLWKVKVVKE